MDFALKMLKLCLVTSSRALEITNLIGLELEQEADPHGRERIHREDERDSLSNVLKPFKFM
jgi:hypothetical protein